MEFTNYCTACDFQTDSNSEMDAHIQQHEQNGDYDDCAPVNKGEL